MCDIVELGMLTDRTEQNFIYTQAVIYGIWGYLQWAFRIIIFDKI